MNPLSPQTAPQNLQPPGLQGALAVMTRRHFSPFRVFIARENRTVVILNPKVGTTSFRHVVQRAYREVLGRKDMSQGRYKLFRKARQFPFPPLRDYVHAFAHPEHYNFYCFVRNPYARIKSAWVDKLAFGHDSEYPPSIRDEVIVDLRRFARKHNLPGGENNSAVPFATFVAYIEAEETGKRNHHWDEQYSILFMDRIPYTQIFKMEGQFAEGMTHILLRLGVPESWASEVLAKPQNESRKINEAVFNEDFAARIQRIFARDFDALGYDTDSWRGM
jgi:hypothetical protein